MKRYVPSFIFLIVTLTMVFVLPNKANAAKGVVTFYKSGSCDYFVVETKSGYDLLEWFGGYDPDEGDIIVGDFETYGMKDVYDITTDREIRIWVEDYWLSKDEALENYYDKCK